MKQINLASTWKDTLDDRALWLKSRPMMLLSLIKQINLVLQTLREPKAQTTISSNWAIVAKYLVSVKTKYNTQLVTNHGHTKAL